MTQVHFTMNSEDIQNLIEKSVTDSSAKLILTTVFNQLMEEQRTEHIQAANYERTDNRTTQRNGYYDREYTTRIGTLTLKVPRTRDGEFSPTIFERYQRNEKALLAAIVEMYVSGVSTRKVTQIVEELCGKSVSKSFVSSLTKELDPIVEEWRNRALVDTKYPFLMTDVLYIKVREDKRVISKSCHIAIGISNQGNREILGFMIENGESEDSWVRFFQQLKDRGLSDTKLVISDAHAGQVSAIKKVFAGASWQRCQVHFMRNILSVIPRKNSKAFRESLKSIFRYTDIEIARKAKDALIQDYADDIKYRKACDKLDEGFEDAFQYSVITRQTYNRLKSTNALERLNEEIRRREKVIRIFPNEQSAIRLIGTILMDINEEWISSSKKYINLDDEDLK